MRYLPLTPDDRTAMLAAIGAKSIDDLFVDVPEAARLDGPVDLPRVAGELAHLALMPFERGQRRPVAGGPRLDGGVVGRREEVLAADGGKPACAREGGRTGEKWR